MSQLGHEPPRYLTGGTSGLPQKAAAPVARQLRLFRITSDILHFEIRRPCTVAYDVGAIRNPFILQPD